MSKNQVRSGNALQITLQQVPRLQDMKNESQVTARNGGRRLMTLFASFVDPLRLQQEEKVVVRMRMMFLNWLMKSSTMITIRNSPLSMLGRSCAMTRNACELSTTKTDGSSKRRRCEDGAQSSSHAYERNIVEDDQVTNRPLGVKAAKSRGKRTTLEGKALSEFQSMWSIKEKDLAMKEKLSKMGLLDSLIAKKGPLSEYEEGLKNKLITDMLSN